VWLQLVNVNKDWVRIKLINGGKYNNIIGQIILDFIWPKPSFLEFGACLETTFRNHNT
jgi:hypothetical protein